MVRGRRRAARPEAAGKRRLSRHLPAARATRPCWPWAKSPWSRATYAAARWYWERILPGRSPAGPAADVAGLSRHDARPGDGARAAGVGFDLGRRRRSGAGGAGRVGPPAPRRAGRLGGREVELCRGAGSIGCPKRLLAESAGRRPIGRPSPATRPATRSPRTLIDAGQVAWRVPLSKDSLGRRRPEAGYFALANALELLIRCWWADGVFVNDRREIRGRAAADGRPALGRNQRRRSIRDPVDGTVAATLDAARTPGRARDSP